MNLIEITYTKIKYIIRKFPRIRRLSFFIGENKTKRSGRSMLNQSNKVFCICVSFQESPYSVKEEPETNFYDMVLSYWRTF